MKVTATLCLMVKAPRSGTVKTRLAAGIGADAALRVYRALVERQCSQVPVGWQVEVHHAPPDAGPEMRAWLGPRLPHEATFHAQPEGDLGERLRTAFQDARRRNGGAVLLVGGDCPGLITDRLEEAARALDEDPVVIIPATDGGYVLIGLTGDHAFVFEAIPWSTSDVLTETLRRLRDRGIAARILTALDDVDDLESLKRALTEGFSW